MNARAGSGWQTVLADLCLILFMLSAATLSQAADGNGVSASPRSEPVAVYAARSESPPLADWLAEQPRDPRQQLTIVAHYAPGGQEAAILAATALARQSGMAARIVVEPGEVSGMTAILAYDAAPVISQRTNP